MIQPLISSIEKSVQFCSRARRSEPALFIALLLRDSYLSCIAPIGSEKLAVRVAIGEPPAGYL